MSESSVHYWFDFFREDSILEFLPDRFDSIGDMRGAIEWLIENYSRSLSEIVRITLAVHGKDDPETPRGFVSFGPLPEDNTKRELAYAIDPAFTGQGYATEASERFLKWTDQIFAVSPTYASIDPRNRASLRVARKLGFELTGEADRPQADPAGGHLILERYASK